MRRFWDKVDKRRGPNECWPWSAGRFGSGYGEFWADGRQVGAHIFSVLLDGRRVPEGMSVLHECDNRSCVNPKHLYVGTQSDNVQDSYDRNRRQQDHEGERNPRSKLTPIQVREIRARLEHEDPRTIAGDYPVGPGTIYNIRSGLAWKSIT